MKLIHYAAKEFTLEPRHYYQGMDHSWSKPRGLWVSVEGDHDWSSWCKNEDFALERLEVAYEVKLKKTTNILHLKTREEIINFGKRYPCHLCDTSKGRNICETYELNWTNVKEEYQGIMIAPYQYDCRLAEETSWYYGWDCASGCLWDLTCIEELVLIEGPSEKSSDSTCLTKSPSALGIP